MIPPARHKKLIKKGQIPKFVRRIVRKLKRNGFDTMIVGGCIRDLLLGLTPKDFDVVTSATPEQISSVFKNSRLIGRRFKLVHVYAGPYVVEVSTFRRKPDAKAAPKSAPSLNLYGSMEDDWLTRDFTINALYYDPEREVVLDHVHGIDDVKNRNLRCIGDVRVRFLEDPCRMLRAIRFQVKLGLRFSSGVEDALRVSRKHLTQIKAARLRDQLEKLFLSGHAKLTFEQLCHFGMNTILFPDSGSNRALAIAAMENSDKRVREEKNVTLGFLIAAIHWNRFAVRTTQSKGKGLPQLTDQKIANEIIRRQRHIVSLPKHLRNFVMDTWLLQRRLENVRQKQVRSLLVHKHFRAAFDLFVLRAHVGDADRHLAKWWTDLQEMSIEDQEIAIAALRSRRKRNRRNRRHLGETTKHASVAT